MTCDLPDEIMVSSGRLFSCDWKKKHQWVPAPEILPEIYVSMYLNYGCSLVIFCNIQTWCEGFHATLMITWILVTIHSIKNLKSTRNSLFHKYMHILIYMYINEPFSLQKMCEMHGGWFFALWGLLKTILVDKKWIHQFHLWPVTTDILSNPCYSIGHLRA